MGKSKKEERRKRRHSSSSDESDCSEKKSKHRDKKKHKKEKKRKKEREHKKKKQDKQTEEEEDILGPLPVSHTSSTSGQQVSGTKESQGRRLTPMTKEEWEKEQNKLYHVVDPETGRNRLVKGSGEIMEEIVSKERHKQINKQATLNDGLSYQRKSFNL